MQKQSNLRQKIVVRLREFELARLDDAAPDDYADARGRRQLISRMLQRRGIHGRERLWRIVERAPRGVAFLSPVDLAAAAAAFDSYIAHARGLVDLPGFQRVPRPRRGEADPRIVQTTLPLLTELNPSA